MKDSTLVFIILMFTAFTGMGQVKFVPTKINKSTGQNSEAYKSFTFNGSWCWFSDPRAVYYEGKHKRTYSGWIDNYGNIIVGSYDHDTKEIKTHIVCANLEIDDHDNPSILIDNEGRLLIFFTRHGYGSTPEPKPIYLVKSLHPEDISQWGEIKHLYLNDIKDKVAKTTDFTHTYSNPIQLKNENGKMFVFWRGVDGKPEMSASKDDGNTWSVGKILFKSDPIYRFRRPYTKIYSDGKSRIHFVFTLGHPDRETGNSIYYCYYENGAFYKANGKKIKTVAELPLEPKDMDLVYDAKKGDARAWDWDVAEDKKDNPIIAYVKFPTTKDHIYCYAKWTGKEWKSYNLVNSGGWFPKTPKGRNEEQPYYSGGMSIDHENSNILYLSVKRDSVFEIEKWTTQDGGKSWNVDFVTHGSTKDNIRPFAVRGAEKGNPLQVLWMQNTNYIEYSFASWTTWINWSERFQSAIKMGIESPAITNPLKSQQIVDIMRQTADWQFANPYDLKRLTDWQWGTFYVGVQALYEITHEDRYKQEMINIGKHAKWRVNDKIFYADMLTVISNWAWLYGLDKNSKMIENSRWVLDATLATRRAYKADVRFAGNPYFDEWWTWCDALFVAPPSFARMAQVTGEKKYLDYMDKMYWITADYLYSKKDSLMFRDDRYFDKRSENGKKIFWGRGNGWVISSIARILNMMPKDYPSRGKYVQLYHEMSTRLLELQGKDGGWRVSLLDPEYQDVAEMSGSAFYVYALAWGLNNGLLDQKFRPQIEKGWEALCKNVNKNGRFGNVQPEGIDPRGFTPENWQVYGTGAFLLAGGEMYKLASVKE